MSEMLAEMSACAYRLGMAFGAEAERMDDSVRCVELFQLFDRCFFAVRVATALQLRLRREGGAAVAREPAGDAGVLSDPPETERPEPDEAGRKRFEADRDRDRETERASLPVLLATLKSVSADAAALPGPAPAELPTLQALIARLASEPSPTTWQPPPLRGRLAGSAAVAVTAPPRARPSPGLPVRRATGPP
jgi:hypothetical protein